jgi:hypothetical protein
MISRRHRTIFVHIPKCAGQSVEMAFLADHGLTWETRAPLLLRPNPDPALGPPRLAHLTASDYVARGHVTADEFREFYTFAIVRNPWTRAVSLYRHLAPDSGFADFVGGFLTGQLADPAADQFWFVRPQVDFVTEGGALIVDDILRFETLGADFERVIARSGLGSPLPHANRSGARTRPDIERRRSAVRRLAKALRAALRPGRFESHENWRDYYDADTAARIGCLYAEDCSFFGYSFEQHGSSR